MSANAAESGFFVKHVEKFVLGVVMLMVGFFIYSGMSIEPFPESKTPDSLKSLASRAKETIEKDSWLNVQDEPERATNDITVRLRGRDEVMTSVPSDPYQPQMAWSNPEFRLQSKRPDPELYPPINLEVSAHYGPVAMRAREGDEDLLRQDAVVEEEESSKDEDEEGLFSSGGLGGITGMSGMTSMSGNAGGETRTLNEEQLANLEGYRPGSSGGGGGGGASMGMGTGMEAAMRSIGGTTEVGATPGSVIQKGLRFVALKAVVPYKKQWFENERVLQDAMAYTPLRDAPKYVYYKVERAEVGDDPNAELKWKMLSTARTRRFAELWGGRSDEIVDPRYIDPFLSFPAPPLMMRSGDFALHSLTPKKRVFDHTAMQRHTVEESPDGPDRPDVPGRSGSGIGGAAGMGGFGVPGMNPGGGGGNAMREGMQGAGGYGAGAAGMSGAAGMMGSGGMGMTGMGGGMGMMGMGGGMGLTTGAPDVDYKLFRFYDFTVKPNKRYRYRIQLWLEDVNYPQDPQLAPPASSLSDVVSRRVNEKKAADAASKNNARTYWRETEWSKPSDIISIPQQYQVYAGSVRTDKPVVLRDKGVSYPKPGGEPNAKMMAVVWSPKYGADIPGVVDVLRGSVLDFTQNADVAHPIGLDILTLPEYKYKTGNIVLDIRGGDAMPSMNSTLKASDLSPGEFLLVDATGKMVVHNELDDLVSFRNFDYRKPPEPKKRKKDKDKEDEFEGMSGLEGMFGGLGGEESGGGRRGSRRGGR